MTTERDLLIAAMHALRSYQFGNASTELAKDVAGQIESRLANQAAPSAQEPVALTKTPDDWRMNAYYFGFSATGIAAIDRILSSVACAGKSSHHTDCWLDSCEPYPHLRGDSCAEWIQRAAEDAVKEVHAAVAAERKAAYEECAQICDQHAAVAWNHKAGILACAAAIREKGQ